MKYLKIISQLNVNDKNAIFIFMILPYRREDIIKPMEGQRTFNKLPMHIVEKTCYVFFSIPILKSTPN
jgi:hypothetical protein